MDKGNTSQFTFRYALKKSAYIGIGLIFISLIFFISSILFSRQNQNLTLTQSVLETDYLTATYQMRNRPPVYGVFYSPDRLYAADIAVYNLYVFNTQENRYLTFGKNSDSIQYSGITLDFVFNNDGTLIAGYDCLEYYSSHACYNYSVSILQLFESHFELLQYFSPNELPLESISNLQFENVDGQEMLYLRGCIEREFSTGMVVDCRSVEWYWDIVNQLWLPILNE